MNPEHLLDQADRLLVAPARGARRQADKRRAISAVYYAVFHAVARATADTLVGRGRRQEPRYVAVYRTVSHRRLKELCQEILKPTPSTAWRPYWPTGGFTIGMQAFATLCLRLLQPRHAADYDPTFRVHTFDAQDVVGRGRAALQRLANAPPEERSLFVTLLVSSPQA